MERRLLNYDHEVRRIETRVRSLMDAALREAERNIPMVIIFSTQTGVYTTGLAATNLVLKKIGRRPQPRVSRSSLPPSPRPPGSNVDAAAVERRDRSFLSFFFRSRKSVDPPRCSARDRQRKTVKRVTSLSLASRRMRIVQNGRPPAIIGAA